MAKKENYPVKPRSEMKTVDVYPVKPRSEMKTVDVIFVSDDIVTDFVLPRKEYERQQQRKLKEELKDLVDDVPTVRNAGKRKSAGDSGNAKRSKVDDNDDVELALAALENDEVEKVAVNQPTTLFDEDCDVVANKMYTFTSKKAIAKSPLNKAKPITNNLTPKVKKPLEIIEEETASPQTPYILRKREKDIKEIRKILENSDDEGDFSASDSEYSASSSDASESEVTDEKPKSKGKRVKIKRKSYFEMQFSPTKNSKRSVKDLKNPKLTRERVDEICSHVNLGEPHKPQLKQLFRNQVIMFEKWEYLLRHNYSVLLYGLGSKKDVMEKFLMRFVNHYPVVTVNGFFPSVTVKDILDKVCEPLKIDSSSSDVVENIESKLKDYDVRIYIGVNNIDGIMIRSKKNQQILARLARLDKIKLIATIDHINAPLMWDQCLLTDFNWAWFDGTTFLPYNEETVYEGNLLLHSSGHLTLSSLRSVYGSLTKNTRLIFLIIVRAQLASDKNWGGISFRELYHEGRRQLLVSADAALRLQLKEFIDHAILKQKRSPEGEEKYIITLDPSILKQFLEEQDGL